MISIITAVHNGLPFNRLYFESLERYTYHPFELIIIDNASTDGSREYFESKGCVVIANNDNYNYPYCQNQGIRVAKGHTLFFLNNDLIVSPHWDKHLMEVAEMHGLDIISACGIENLGDAASTRSIRRKWKRTKNPLMLFGISRVTLQAMLRLMYGRWERFCKRRLAAFGTKVAEGIVGNNVMMTRRGLEKVGEWDERIQHADFDLFIRTKKRAEEVGDIRPCHIALGVFIHHFIRMTQKYAKGSKPFVNAASILYLHDKWNEEELDRMHPDNATIRKK